MKRTALVGALVTLASCSSNSAAPPEGCDEKLVDGTCAGVSRAEICQGAYCTADAPCSRVWYVREGAAEGDGSEARPLASLAEAATQAGSGECIALAAGSYAGAAVKGGVSLLGKGAGLVTIKGDLASGLQLSAGTGGLLRGFSLSGAGVGLVLQDVHKLRVEEVRVERASGVGIDVRGSTELSFRNLHVKRVSLLKLPKPDAGPADAASPDVRRDAGVADALLQDAQLDAGAATDARQDKGTAKADTGAPQPASDYGIGILLAKGSSAWLTRSAVVGSGSQGILAHGSSVVLKDSVVSGSGSYGVAIDCSNGCPAAGSEISGSSLQGNAGIGLLVLGGKLVARQNDIGLTSYKAGASRGVQIQGGAEVLLEGNRVHDGVGQGIVIDGSKGTLTSNRVESNQERGVVLQQIAAPGLLLEENQILGNERAGLAALASVAVTIKGGRVSDTKKRVVLVEALSAMVGDGLQILSKSSLTIKSAKIEGNQRVGVVIDDAVAVIGDTVVSGGEAGVAVQNANASDQTLTNVVDGSGTAVKLQSPASAYLLDKSSLIETLPIPLP